VDRFRRDVENASLQEELQTGRKAIPATNLAFWGWLPITDGAINYETVTLVSVPEESSAYQITTIGPSVPVVIENVPQHWNGQGVLNYEDDHPGASVQLQITPEFARGGRVVKNTPDLRSLPNVASKTKTGFSKLSVDEEAIGVLCCGGALYLCWSNAQEKTIAWEQVASLNITAYDLTQVGRPRNLVKLAQGGQIEEAHRAFAKRDLSL
jgi:hypothetical protein